MTTATRLQLRRGTAAQVATFTGAQGEVTPDISNWRLVLHDGATPGGRAQASEAYVQQQIAALLAGAAPLSLPTGVLSLSSTSGTPTTDITAATSLYYIDAGGGYIPIWSNALSAWVSRYFTGSLQLPLDGNATHSQYHLGGDCNDVYAVWNPGIGAASIGTSNIIGADFSGRGYVTTNLTLKNGLWVNAASFTLRVTNAGNVAGVDILTAGVNEATYLGTIGYAVDGQSEDSAAKRLVFNAYNPKPRVGRKKWTGANYAYTTAAYRQVGGDGSMQVETVLGLPGIMCEVEAWHFAQGSSAGVNFDSAFGLNATTEIMQSTNDCTGASLGRILDTTGVFGAGTRWRGYPGARRHTFKWLEYGGTGITFQSYAELYRNGLQVTALAI